MYPRVLFIDRDGVRVDDRWIFVRGRRIAVANLREVTIVEGPPDAVTVAVAAWAAAVSIAALAIMTGVSALAARIVALAVIGLALAVAVCTPRLRPPAVSLRAHHSGRQEVLIESGSSMFVNQIGRAVIRAREWNDIGNPAVYRIPGRHVAPQVSIGLILVVGIGATILTVYGLLCPCS